jgi:chromosome segregation ATPase
VTELLHGKPREELRAERVAEWLRPEAAAERRKLSQLQARLTALESRMSAVEQRVGTGAETRELDRQIEQARREKAAAARAQEYERAASLRDQENHLRAEQEALQQDWQDAHPALPVVAEQLSELSGELDRLRGLLREHGIEPEGETA